MPVASLLDERTSMMFGTLSLAAALTLAPAQAVSLKLTNARFTYGELGAPHNDSKFLPGEYVILAFDIEGLPLSAEGKVTYTMSMEVTDKANKVVFKQEKPAESEEVLPLGGSRLPARGFVSLKGDQEPGIYTCKMTVTDKESKSTSVLEKQFEVIPKTFRIAGLFTTNDIKGEQLAPPVGVVGQNLFVHFALVNFGRGADKKPNSQVEMRVLDESKRPTLAKAISAVVPKEIADDDPALFRFVIPFNREGTFTAEFKAIDNVTGKTSIVSFPVKVVSR